MFSLGQVPFALSFPALAERTRWVTWSAVSLALGLAGTAGVLLAPEPGGPGPAVWVVLVAGGVGAGFPLGLALIAFRTPDARASEAVASMCLGTGYLVAGVAPLVMGLLRDLTGTFTAPVVLILAAGLVQAVVIARLRRP